MLFETLKNGYEKKKAALLAKKSFSKIVFNGEYREISKKNIYYQFIITIN